MTLKTGKRCEWKDIEVGEVFACESASSWFSINYKHSKKAFYCVDHSRQGLFLGIELENTFKEWAINSNWLGQGGTYKLPLSVQRLWRCDR